MRPGRTGCDVRGMMPPVPDKPRRPERPSEQVTADLRRRIESDEWKAGEVLPTVAVLAEHYQVSRTTVTRSLRALEAAGLVRIVPRWGTFRA